MYSASRFCHVIQFVEAACLKTEFSTVESDAEEERGKDERHGACDHDTCNAAGEATNAGLKLGL